MKCNFFYFITKMKVAIFGSSYVKRASNFADFVRPLFGIGWNTASDPCLYLTSKILIYSTDIVVVCLGGNKISRGVEPPTFVYCPTRLFQKIKALSPRQPEIFFSEIVSRGKFRIPLHRNYIFNLTPDGGQSTSK